MSTDHPEPAGERPAPPGAGGETDHSSHDELLITRFVGGDVTPAERERVTALLESCVACRMLASDLVAIAHALVELPPPARTRDFRLTPEEAARLAPGGVRGWLTRLRSPSTGPRRGWLAALQPAAGGLAAIGLVMAIVTSPAGLLATGGASTAHENAQDQFQAGIATAAPARVSAGGAGLGSAAASAAALPAASAAPAALPAASAAPAINVAPGPSAAPAASPEPGMLGATSCGSADTSNKGSTACATGSEAPLAAAPVGGARPGAEGAQPITLSQQPAPAKGPIEAWQLWLVLAAAGAVALGAMRLALRRAE